MSGLGRETASSRSSMGLTTVPEHTSDILEG
jgi:hypothetical protein